MTLPLSATLLAASTSSGHTLPPSWTVLPFVALLLCIAVMPLFAANFWEHHYQKVALGLGLITAGYYFFILHDAPAVLHSMTEYLSFMALVVHSSSSPAASISA